MKLFKSSIQEEMMHVFEFAFVGILGNLLITLLTALLFINLIEIKIVYNYVLILLIIYVLRVFIIFQYRKRNKENKKLVILFYINIFIASAFWGISIIWISRQNIPQGYEFILLTIITGLSASGITTLGWVFSLYCVFFIPLYLPFSIYLYTLGDHIHFVAGIMTSITIPFFLKTAFSYNSFYLKLKKKNVQTLYREKKFSSSILDLSIKILEDKDLYTAGHAKRVSDLSVKLGKKMKLTLIELEILQRGSYLHDIGKLSIPDYIIKKEGPLTNDEYKIIITHPQKGEEILKKADDEIINKCIPIVKYHHERVDSLGYPEKLCADRIPLLAKIVAITDTYDAITTSRSYKRALPKIYALSEIDKNSGSQFDKTLVNLFIELMLDKEKISIKNTPKLIRELKDDHSKILDLFSKLFIINPDSGEYKNILNDLKKLINEHIEKENVNFYPKLLKITNTDKSFKQSLEYFMTNFNELSNLIEYFFKTFDKKGLTSDHHFVKAELSSLLVRRINLEESILFSKIRI